MLKVGVKHHAHRAHQQPPRGQYRQLVTVQGNQAVGCHFFQGRPLGRKIPSEVDIECLLNARKRQVQVANDLLNDFASESVILVTDQATTGGELSAGQTVLIVRDVAVVLAVQVADLADGRDAQPNQIAMPVGGVALEVALQGGFFLSDGQFVIGQGKVIHADVAITRFEQLPNGVFQHLQLGSGSGQVADIDTPLGHETLG